MTESAFRNRTILFLQGPPSPFWYEISDALVARGARTLRINFSTADWVFWRRSNRLNYRGRFENWPDYLRAVIHREGVTDILYFSDRFPYHAAAQEVARECGINAFVVEFGYLRPGWLTLEQGGMGAWSHFPVDPAEIRAIAARCGEQDSVGFEAHKGSTELTFEILFHLINQYYFYFFPFFRKDRVYNATFEYLCGAWHRIIGRWNRSGQEKLLKRYSAGDIRFTFVALQLQTDYQIRANTRHKDQRAFLREVVASFANNAPTDHRLLVKTHPYESGTINWKAEIDRLSREFGVTDRVDCVAHGDTEALIARAHGVIISNSTVGLMAVRALRPTLNIGTAIYDIPGLTHHGGIDTFWTKPDPVDPTLRDAFVTALAGTIQLRGSVYDPEGRKLAAATIAARVLEDRVNSHGAFVASPPRLGEVVR